MRSDLAAKYPPALVQAARVTLLQSGDAILTQFDATLAAAALEALRAGGVEVRTRARVAEVRAGAVTLRGGEELRCGVCVWSAGNAPRPLVTQLRAALQPSAGDTARGKLLVDPWMRCMGARDVLALGDCSAAAGGGPSAALPATAQVAAQQGAYAARLINRGYAIGAAGLDAPPPHRRRPPPLFRLGGGGDADADGVEAAQPFEFLSLGLLAYVGDNDALTQVDAGALHLRYSGSFAALLWRSVYVTKQVSLRNRVLILFDWAKTRVFGRDLSQF